MLPNTVEPPIAPASIPPPRLLDQLRRGALEFGHPATTAGSFVEWSRQFILFHGKRHPRELSVAEVGQFLDHVARSADQPLRAIEEARTALAFLFGEVLRIDLGELPRPQPPRLLDRVHQVLRVRHDSPRTEESAGRVGQF